VASVLDAEVGDVAVLRSLAAAADHVVFSELGFGQFAGTAGDAALQRLVAAGARVAAVTRGAAGVTWADAGGGLRHCAACPVDVVDTLAAGDVFHGAYALAIAEGRATDAAIRFASAAAAIKCSRPGGRNGAPTRAETEEFLAARS
jgi:sulfofructose kinase